MHDNTSSNIRILFKNIFFLACLSSLTFSCKKFVQIPPPAGQLVSQSLFASDATATSAILGIYSRMVSSNGFASGGIVSIPVLTGLSGDELNNYALNPWQIQFYTNTLSINNSLLESSLWSEPYQYIYTANACIEGISASGTISSGVKNQLLGEAMFIRAFCYFYLVNLFGDVPLLTESSYLSNSNAKRESGDDVYKRVVADLNDAENLLSDDYTFDGGERVRPNKSAAQAMLARVFLYNKDWANAERYADTLLSKTNDFALPQDLDSVFLVGSTEAIWQLKPVAQGYNTNEANTFILTGSPVIVTLSPQLVGAFETGDFRKNHWVQSTVTSGTTYFYPFKYKISFQTGSSSLVEYSIVLRLAEQYLIRAEAEAQQNDLTDAATDLNTIRNRAGLANTIAVTQADLLTAILHERQVELFTEWGHRWLDLKRTQAVDSVMPSVTQLKGGQWNTNEQLYPIPQPDRQSDPNLGQNPGY